MRLQSAGVFSDEINKTDEKKIFIRGNTMNLKDKFIKIIFYGGLDK